MLYLHYSPEVAGNDELFCLYMYRDIGSHVPRLPSHARGRGAGTRLGYPDVDVSCEHPHPFYISVNCTVAAIQYRSKGPLADCESLETDYAKSQLNNQ